MPGILSKIVPLVVGLALLLGGISTSTAAEPPIIAAASDLQFALREIAEQFTAATGRKVRLNFGSSGNFRRQIAQGAPFELYLSANEDYVRALHKAGHTIGTGELYAIGRVAIIAPTDRDAIVDAKLETLRQKLASGKLGRFAIANPEHAPYGVSAKQVLQSFGLWEAIQPHLILGENVSQAAQFALSGETEGGIVAYSLALAPPLRGRANHVLLPSAYHKPLRQRMVLLRGAGKTARQFYHYLQQQEARTIFNRYGFTLPDETTD